MKKKMACVASQKILVILACIMQFGPQKFSFLEGGGYFIQTKFDGRFPWSA